MLATANRPRAERRLVATMAFGDEVADLAALTMPGQQAYARRLDADYHVVNKPRIAADSPFYEIFQLNELIGDYDRTLYLDLDVLVRPNCPDLFNQIPSDSLGVFFESRLVDRTKAIRQIEQSWSPLSWSGDYFNNGVMVFSSVHRGLFHVEREFPAKLAFSDQTVNNYLAVAHEFKVFDLGLAFNYMPALLGRGPAARYFLNHVWRGMPRIPWLYRACPEPENAFMVHLAGYDLKTKLRLADRLLAVWNGGHDGRLTQTHHGLNRVFHALRPLAVEDAIPSADPFMSAVIGLCDGNRTVDEIVVEIDKEFPRRGNRARWVLIKRLLNAQIHRGAMRALNQL